MSIILLLQGNQEADLSLNYIILGILIVVVLVLGYIVMKRRQERE